MERDISKEAIEASSGRFRFHKRFRGIRSTPLLTVGFLKSVQPKSEKAKKREVRIRVGQYPFVCNFLEF